MRYEDDAVSVTILVLMIVLYLLVFVVALRYTVKICSEKGFASKVRTMAVVFMVLGVFFPILWLVPIFLYPAARE